MQQLKLFGGLLVVLATVFVPLHAVSVSRVGDVLIYVNDTNWKCDKIECPPETYLCRVTKRKLEPKATQLQRVDTCYSANNEVLKESITYEPIGADENVSVNINSYRSGITSSSSNMNGFQSGSNYNYMSSSSGGEFDRKQLDDSLANVERINQEVEDNIRQVNQHIQTQMAALNQQLQQNLGSWFNHFG